MDSEKSICKVSILDRVKEIVRRAAGPSERHLLDGSVRQSGR